MRCPANNTHNFGIKSTDKYCYVCGTRLKSDLQCPCGETLSPEDYFCPSCGQQTKKNSEKEE
jgi:hypothetical protein